MKDETKSGGKDMESEDAIKERVLAFVGSPESQKRIEKTVKKDKALQRLIVLSDKICGGIKNGKENSRC